MKNKKFSIAVFLISFISLLISLKLFWNMAIFADEYNSSATIINGGNFWLLMDWVRLLLLFLLCIISVINIFKSSAK
jgi:hypothetical protein